MYHDIAQAQTLNLILQHKNPTPRGLCHQWDQNFFAGLKQHDPYDLRTKQVLWARQQMVISAPSLNNSLDVTVYPPNTYTSNVEEKGKTINWTEAKLFSLGLKKKAFLVLCVCSIVFLQFITYILKPEQN